MLQKPGANCTAEKAAAARCGPMAMQQKLFPGGNLGYVWRPNVPRMFFHCRRLLLLLLAGLPALVRGDGSVSLPQDFTPRVWSKQQGLPDNSVTAVLQTRDGYLWIGTSGGLARFDGVRFVPLVPTSEKTNDALRVTALCEDASGRLWIGTQGDGLFRYADGLITPYRAATNELDDTINSIAEDSAGMPQLKAVTIHPARRPSTRMSRA